MIAIIWDKQKSRLGNYTVHGFCRDNCGSCLPFIRPTATFSSRRLIRLFLGTWNRQVCFPEKSNNTTKETCFSAVRVMLHQSHEDDHEKDDSQKLTVSFKKA